MCRDTADAERVTLAGFGEKLSEIRGQAKEVDGVSGGDLGQAGWGDVEQVGEETCGVGQKGWLVGFYLAKRFWG